MKLWMWIVLAIVVAIIIFLLVVWWNKRQEQKNGEPQKKNTVKKAGTAAAAAGALILGGGAISYENRAADGTVERQTATEASFYSSNIAAGNIDNKVTRFVTTTNKDGKRVVADGYYYGNKNSHIYMGPGTTVRSNANPKNYVRFQSDQQALDAGYAQSKDYQRVINKENQESSSSK